MPGKNNTIRIAKKLQDEAYKLFYPQDNDEYSYIDKYQEANSRIVRWRNKLAHTQGDTAEEEAEICLALLMGCKAYVRDDERMEKALERTQKVLPLLPDGLVKCSLLIFCYSEVYNEKILEQARQIIGTWQESNLSEEQRQAITILKDTEENIHPC